MESGDMGQLKRIAEGSWLARRAELTPSTRFETTDAPRFVPLAQPLQFGAYLLLERSDQAPERYLALRNAPRDGRPQFVVIDRVRSDMKHASHEALLRHQATRTQRSAHPNLVRCYELGHVGQVYYAAYQHVSGSYPGAGARARRRAKRAYACLHRDLYCAMRR